jgi:hypothetical protein
MLRTRRQLILKETNDPCKEVLAAKQQQSWEDQGEQVTWNFFLCTFRVTATTKASALEGL